MISNLKVDIIYYKTSSDFELEFNLSGCCRMRIFKDKIDSAKELVKALARDVSRSRVILIVTDLVGEKNGVEIVCSSIGYKYEPVNKEAHSIKNDENISAPAGSLPLVTKSGEYGGCILESGKQSIIIVSSDRALRHEVMRLYIHQYVFDINQVEAYNERLRHESEHNPIIDGSNILNTARHEIETVEGVAEAGAVVAAGAGVVLPTAVPSAPVVETPTEDATPDAGAETVPTEDATPDTETETVPTEEITAPETEVASPAEEIAPAHKKTEENSEKPVSDIISHSGGFVAMTADYDDEEEDEIPKISKRQRRRGKGSNIALLVISVLLLVCFGLLAYYFVYVPIMGGEMTNDLIKIISEVLPWTT